MKSAFRKSKKSNKYKNKGFDLSFLFLIVGLTCFGVLMVYDASVVEAHRDFADKFYYLKHQSISALLGFFIMFFFAFFDYKNLKKLAPILFFINVLLLFAVLIPGLGVKVKGARRWLNLGFFHLQPTEFIKLNYSLYLASWLSFKRPLSSFLLLLGIILGLIILQPDLGTAVVITVSAFLIYYLSGAKIKNIILLGLIGFVIGTLLIITSSYRRDRLLTFLRPARDPLGKSYHIRQVLIALGNGGLFGLGLGQSRQKYEYLPEASADSIFAIIAEELGFFGAAFVIIIFYFLILKGFKIAQNAPDEFSGLLAYGIVIWFAIQSIINLGAMVVLLPLTGIPLPLISYGGSSLISSLAACGILLNISSHSKRK